MTTDYYSIPAKAFHKHSPITFHFVHSHEDLCKFFARDLIELMKENRKKNQMTKIIMAVGPIDFQWFATYCNQENISCKDLVIFSMDEFIDAEGRFYPQNSSLNFRGFYQKNLIENLDPDKRFPPEQLIMPDPQDLDMVYRKLEKYGPIDVTFGGSGIDGHYAFNFAPQGNELSLDEFINTSVHIAELPEAFIVQMAMGATGGNLEIVPTRGCSLGIKELLSAKMLYLTFFRPWHAGVLRRALFGPVTPMFPTSVVQLHPNVKAVITDAAAALPTFDALQNVGQLQH
jgi:glucosamine-6-phosphate deaminase